MQAACHEPKAPTKARLLGVFSTPSDALARWDQRAVEGRGRVAPDGVNRQLSAALWNKGIWHAFREWDGWSHDWPYWAKMTRLYIRGHD